MLTKHKKFKINSLNGFSIKSNVYSGDTAIILYMMIDKIPLWSEINQWIFVFYLEGFHFQ